MSNGTFLALAAAGVAVVASGIAGRGSLARKAKPFQWYYENGRMSPQVKDKANDKLRNVGMDGNGRFANVGAAVNVMWDVMGKHKLEIVSVSSAHRFEGKEGTTQLDVGWKDTDSPFNERTICDSVLHVSYHEVSTGKYEVVAYLS